MKLTHMAWDRLRGSRVLTTRESQDSDRHLACMRRHPGTGELAIEPVELQETVAPAECEHAELRVTSQQSLGENKLIAVCLTCRASLTASAQRTAAQLREIFMTLYPPASFRWVTDVTGTRLGWVERIADRWLAMSTQGPDAPHTCIASETDAETAAAVLFARHGRTPTGGVPR